jgi:hypothetical protein
VQAPRPNATRLLAVAVAVSTTTRTQAERRSWNPPTNAVRGASAAGQGRSSRLGPCISYGGPSRPTPRRAIRWFEGGMEMVAATDAAGTLNAAFLGSQRFDPRGGKALGFSRARCLRSLNATPAITTSAALGGGTRPTTWIRVSQSTIGAPAISRGSQTVGDGSNDRQGTCLVASALDEKRLFVAFVRIRRRNATSALGLDQRKPPLPCKAAGFAAPRSRGPSIAPSPTAPAPAARPGTPRSPWRAAHPARRAAISRAPR